MATCAHRDDLEGYCSTCSAAKQPATVKKPKGKAREENANANTRTAPGALIKRNHWRMQAAQAPSSL
jgi:hypothetical protein